MLEGSRIGVYRFVMRADEPLYLPEYKGGVLRGGFGTTFRRMACVLSKGSSSRTGVQTCDDCPVLTQCPYKAVFEPSPPKGADRLRNLQDIPRPFILRIPGDPRTRLAPGEHLEWEVALIGDAVAYLPYFIVTFREMGQIGFGLWHDGKRARAGLETVLSVDPFTGASAKVFDGTDNLINATNHLVVAGEDVEEMATRLRQDSVTVDFVSITRLKFRDDFATVPPFHVVIRNLLRRLSTLSAFYQGRPIEIDFRGLIDRAQAVSDESISITWKDWQRYSGRSKETMDFGGFMGRMRYIGDLAEFLPLLLYGSLVNVGKGTTFGLGQYHVQT